jgi:hypothetical protein
MKTFTFSNEHMEWAYNRGVKYGYGQGLGLEGRVAWWLEQERTELWLTKFYKGESDL